jgi:hypothetical protein
MFGLEQVKTNKRAAASTVMSGRGMSNYTTKLISPVSTALDSRKGCGTGTRSCQELPRSTGRVYD